MSGVPDYKLESTVDFKFTTRQFSTGTPFAFASGAIEIYEDNLLTQITGAETLTLEFDGVTGLHNLRVAATAANGFEDGKSYYCVVSAGTVDGVLVVGEVVQQFSIGRSLSFADILTTQMTEVYAADGVAPTLAQAIFAIQQQIGDFGIVGTTMTVRKLDGTTAMTFTLNNGTNPTDIERTG